MIYSAFTDKGKVRSRNEDAYFTSTCGSGAFFAVVCDGMGGEKGGDVASRVAVDGISAAAVKKLRPDLDADGVSGVLLSAITAANGEVFDKASRDGSLSGMGTTVVAAFVSDGNLTVAHAGDSRAYVADENGIRRLTHDHSLVAEMAAKGLITEEEAENHPDKNLITRALGIQNYIDVDFLHESLSPGAVLLLCSDGLSNFVTDDEILEILNDTPTDRAAYTLVQRANENGGGDNITAVAVRITEE